LTLILAKGGQQISKGIDGNFKLANRLAQGDEHGVTRVAGIARLKLLFPPVKQFETVLRLACFVRQIVRPAAPGINVAEMLPQSSRQQPTGDREVFVMPPRQLAAIGFSLGLWNGRIAARAVTAKFKRRRGRHVKERIECAVGVRRERHGGRSLQGWLHYDISREFDQP
jgi:hypothetical protein